MFYKPIIDDHGLPHDPFKSCIVPRPIGWISTVSRDGIHNLAPFSQFQILTFYPPYIMFSSNQNGKGERKDTVVNIEATGQFVHNMATYDLREAVNKSAQPVAAEEDEFELAGVTKAPSQLVKPCRVAESPIHMECEHFQTIRLPCGHHRAAIDVVIGRVVGIHINDAVIDSDGKLDLLKIKPIARLGYHDYSSIESIFSMTVPGSTTGEKDGMAGWTSKQRS